MLASTLKKFSVIYFSSAKFDSPAVINLEKLSVLDDQHFAATVCLRVFVITLSGRAPSPSGQCIYVSE